MGNLYAGIPASLPEEWLQVLWQPPGVRLERIVSRGHVTPPGQWYDQDTDEWVVLLTGAAALRIEGRDEIVRMAAGDFVLLPAGLRHRVEWTDPAKECVWLAVHVTTRSQAAAG